jgi:pimeloyl-ACP methyl ester carboxylesterase
MVAIELALSAPERVDRLVLACTTPGGRAAYAMPEVTVRLFDEAQTLPREVALRRFVENALGPEPDAGVVERIMGHRLETAQPLEAWAAQAAAATTFDAGERVGEIAAPTLVLTGDRDNVIDWRNSELLAERIPDARLDVFHGRGHLFFWEEPERFVRAVREFLA